MKKILLAFCLTLFTGATAQQTVKATYNPVTIDGVVTPNGVVTINGKSYVSLDALKTAKVNFIKPTSLSIYVPPVTKGIMPKLNGCTNEWLTDADTRVRVTSQNKNSDKWIIHLDAQTSQNKADFSKIFQVELSTIQFKDGTQYDPTTNQFLKTENGVYSFAKGETKDGYIALNGMDFSEENPATKLILRPVRGGVWTFDLTCKK